MRFSLSPDQLAFAEAVRSLLADHCGPSVVRSGSGDGVWRQLDGLGLLTAAVPAPLGGLGLDPGELVPTLIEVGYAAVPAPVAETAAVAFPLLAAVRPELLEGSPRAALVGPTGLTPYRPDLLLALDPSRVRLVPPSLAEVSTVDGSRRLGRSTEPGVVLTDDPGLVGLSRQRADLATAAQLIGLGRRMLDLTTSYVGTRQQFGVPVGSFQAVKHQLADALLRLEFAEPAVLAAGWHLSAGPSRSEAAAAVSLAAVLAAEAATFVAKTAIQCHGAIGYTVEYDLHLYAKRAWALAAQTPTDEHLACLATTLSLEGVPT
jgi:alkylation response protein AidB-like acyl-CoA dehydrogenase